MAGTAGAQPATATASAPRLLFFHPFRPGVLAQCENAHLRDSFARDAWPDAADPGRAWWVDEAFTLSWQGGTLVQPRRAPPATALDGTHPATDVCFALLVSGQPVLSGAVVAESSARRTGFTTLVRLHAGRADDPPRYELRARFPGQPSDRAPAGVEALRPGGS